MRQNYCTWNAGLLALAVWVLGQQACWGEPDFEIKRGVAYAKAEERDLLADVYVPDSEGPHPAVLVVHGGAWMSGTRAQLAGVAQFLARRQYTAVAIGYRLAPAHKFPAQIADCVSAVRWMRENASHYKIDPERIGGYGYSAGGHLVALLGMSGGGEAAEEGAHLQAVVAGGAPCEFSWVDEQSDLLTYWLGGSRQKKPDVYQQASPLHFATADDPPVFFFHGENDTLVPQTSPKALQQRLQRLGVTTEMYVVDDASHIGAFFSVQATRRACLFLDHHLRRAPPALWTADEDAEGGHEPSR